MTSFNEREFRNALRLFATGVAIVTAKSGTQLLGSTISSFNSVSLTPPLILFSIARSALGFELWRQVEHYGITILAEHQSELSNRFAKSRIDKWKDVDADTMKNGAPLLPEWLAYFECAAYARHDGGDHEIFVGRVLDFRCRPQAAESRPLLFFKGKYRSLEQSASVQTPPEIDAWSHAW
jgi:flavin reductase (DIM6/NTAB) family NADH-FMN oxidoreductase RutF